MFTAQYFIRYLPNTARHLTTWIPLLYHFKLFEFSISTDCDRPHCGSRILVESITRTREVELQLCSFSISALYGDECLTSRPGRFNPSKDPRCPLNTRLCGPQRGSRRFQNKIIFYAYLDSDPGPSSPSRNG